MKRFQTYMNRAINLDAARNETLLSSLGIEARYVPEQLEEFDEMEFGLGHWRNTRIIFTLVFENGNLKRISLGWIPQGGEEDDMRAFSEPDLAAILNEKGETLARFLDSVTLP
ncbi:MAG: hypothetical protein Kow0099_32670 [Candidatus Abyssubacteria bacterium]